MPRDDASRTTVAPASPERELRAFGRPLSLQRPALCPEIALWLVCEDVDLEQECEALLEGQAPPYWAFCWGGGQVLARYLLDHPAEVADRSVLDLGTGSGVVAIAAALAGARAVMAVDNDLDALAAARRNAAANGVSVEVSRSPDRDSEVLLASDVYFEAGPRDFCERQAELGRRVLVCEPDRPGARHPSLPPLLRAEARTLPDVDSPTRSAAIYRLNP